MDRSQIVCVSDYERKAVELLDKNAKIYYTTGADDEQTLADNTADYRRLRLRPRMMVDVSSVKLNTTILGEKIEFPVCVAPVGMHKLAHPMGEMGTAKATEALGTCMCLSTGSTTSLAELGEKCPNLLKWFQLYVCRDRAVSRRLVDKAEKAGFKALVVTVDLPELGKRREGVRHKVVMPPHISFKVWEEGFVRTSNHENSHEAIVSMFDNALTWQDVRWLTTITALPVIVKGILTGADAEEAIAAGCSAVYVSNHGGRQLDGVFSSITALPEVVEAVAGRVEVYVDGGVRKGTDVLKALALGARAVFVGRPVIYGLAVAGEDGAKNVLEILKNELKLAMQLSGVTDVERIPKELVAHESTLARL